MDPQFSIDPSQMELDRLLAEKERGRDIPVRPPFGDEARDLKFLGSELFLHGRSSTPQPQTRSPQLSSRPLCPWNRAATFEGLERGSSREPEPR